MILLGLVFWLGGCLLFALYCAVWLFRDLRRDRKVAREALRREARARTVLR